MSPPGYKAMLLHHAGTSFWMHNYEVFDFLYVVQIVCCVCLCAETFVLDHGIGKQVSNTVKYTVFQTLLKVHDPGEVS